MTAILIADNAPYWLKQMSIVVQNYGFSVVSAHNPNEALTILGRHEADIAVLDLRLEDDTDDHDVTGLNVAEQTDRMIPKIIVSDYANISDAAEKLRIDIQGFPGIVDFVKKDRIETSLIPSIERAMKIRQTWLAMAQSTVSNHLYQDYKDARRDARFHYLVSMLLSVGFAFPLVFGAFKLHGNGSWSVLFAVMGILIAEVTNYLFGRKLEFLNQRVERFHAELLQTNRFEQLLEASYNIKDERSREAFKIELFNSAANQWLRKSESNLPMLLPKEKIDPE
jgi:CheY-like chemotaxis protein